MIEPLLEAESDSENALSEDESSGPQEMISEAEEAEVYKGVVSAVESGDEKARTKLAWYKLSGRGGAEVDVDGAVVLLEERAKDKDAEAMWMLGMCCEYGMGCEQDLERAESLYKQCGEGGSVIGKFLVWNERCERGSGVVVAKCL